MLSVLLSGQKVEVEEPYTVKQVEDYVMHSNLTFLGIGDSHIAQFGVFYDGVKLFTSGRPLAEKICAMLNGAYCMGATYSDINMKKLAE